jgi:hypothetical protein
MVAFAALFVALGGTAIAQSDILINSSSQIAPKVVRLHHQVQPTFAAGVNKGLGQSGAPFLVNATVETESVSKLGGPNSNTFLVRFSENVAHCQWSATAADFGPGQARGHFATAGPYKFDRKSAVVRTYQISGRPSERGRVLEEPHNFYLLGRC